MHSDECVWLLSRTTRSCALIMLRRGARTGMKAIVVAHHGETDGLQMRELEKPAPKGRQVLVRVHACGVCRRDILVRRGPARPGLSSPLILGHEIAGVVEAL